MYIVIGKVSKRFIATVRSFKLIGGASAASEATLSS